MIKKLLLFSFFVFLSFLSFSQNLADNLKVKTVEYYPDISRPVFTRYSVDVSLSFRVVNENRFITIVNNKVKDSLTFLLTEKRGESAEHKEFYLLSVYSKRPDAPEIVFLITFMFYKATNDIHSIGITDGTDMLIYEILREIKPLGI